jgi:hypothetical protein
MTQDFSAAELTGMRTAHTSHLMDSYVPQVYSRTFNAFGEPVVTYTNGDYTDCALDMRPGSERHGEDSTKIQYDATLRIAITATPDVKDRVMVTHRFGEVLAANLVYEIAGPIQRGPSGIRLLLKRVET